MTHVTYSEFERTLYRYYEPKINKAEFSRKLLSAGVKAADQIVIDNLPDETLSYYRTGKRNLTETILYYYRVPDAYNTVKGYFATEISERISSERRHDLIAELKNLIKADSKISDQQKQHFLKQAKVSYLSEFLAELFVYAVKADNRKTRQSADTTTVFQSEANGKTLTPFPVNNLLYLKNQHFAGREDVLRQIREQFRAGGTVSLTQTIAGLGGVGKTQIALEYAYRYAHEYEVIWWLVAEQAETILAAFAEFALRQNLGEAFGNEKALRVAFLNWLDNHPNWLLVYDNVNSYNDIKPYLPKNTRNRHGNILLTSRLSRGYIGTKMDIEVFEMPEAVQFLLRRTRSEDEAVAAELAKRLGCLPLALEQAAAYIDETEGMNMRSYLKSLDDFGLAVFNDDDEIRDYKQSVTATWKISLDKITLDSTRQLLNLAACIAPDGIDVGWLTVNRQYLPEPLGTDLAQSLTRNRVIRELVKYSLFKYHDGQLSLHRLLQEVIREEWNGDTKWLLLSLNYFSQVFTVPDTGLQTRSEFYNLLPHVNALIGCAQPLLADNKAASVKVAELHFVAGRGLIKLGDYINALAHLRKSLELRESMLGKTNPDTAAAFHNLALVYKLQDKNDQAVTYYLVAAEIRKQVLGDHPDTAATYNNLANVYKNMGEFNKALSWYQKSLAIKMKILGQQHPDTIMTNSNIANVYKRQGNLDAALRLHQQVRKDREQVLGDKHKDTADTFGNIALVYDELGQYDAAMFWFKKTLDVQEEELGIEHPQTAMTYFNIATVYVHQDSAKEARAWYRKALPIQIKRLGFDHSETMQTRKALEKLQKSHGDENLW